MATRILPVNNIVRVKAAATGNLTLSAPQTVDGVSCVAGDLVLAHQQSTGAEKAIYMVAASTWTLCDPGVSDGLLIVVQQGSTLGDKTYKVTNAITWGSGTPTFVDQGGASGSSFISPLIVDGLTASGAGAHNFGASSGSTTLSTGDFGWTGAAGKQVTLTQGIAVTGSPYALKVVAGAHTTLTASTEANDVYFDLSRTVQWATGALATQRAFLIDQPTYGFVGASTVTNAATFAIAGAPTAGTNATLTNSYALWVQAGTSRFDGAVSATDNVTWTGAAGKQVLLTQGVATTGSPYALKVTGGAHTTLTAATEANDVYLNLARTVQFATGALTTQRAVYIEAPTYAFAGASTITSAATVAISGAPVAGTNATLTNSYAFWVQGGAVNLGRATVSQATDINTGVTANGSSGVITTQSAGTAAATFEAGFTLTNSAITSTSVVICTIVAYSGTYVTNGYPTLAVGAPGAGTVAIKVGNTHAANALSGTMKIHFAVL